MQRTVYLRSLNLVRKGQGTAELALASKSLETLHTASALLRSDRTDAATGPAAGDPFTRQLQQKTEEELAELLAAAQQRRPGSGPNGSGAESLDDQEEKASIFVLVGRIFA